MTRKKKKEKKLKGQSEREDCKRRDLRGKHCQIVEEETGVEEREVDTIRPAMDVAAQVIVQ